MRISIEYFMNNGVQTEDAVSGSPCVGVWAVRDNNCVPTNPQRILALIDTGADHVYANPSVIVASQAEMIGNAGQINGAGGDAGVYKLGLVFPGCSTVFSVSTIARDFTQEGSSSYSIVIGRSLLQHFDLCFSPRVRGESYIDIPAHFG